MLAGPNENTLPDRGACTLAAAVHAQVVGPVPQYAKAPHLFVCLMPGTLRAPAGEVRVPPCRVAHGPWLHWLLSSVHTHRLRPPASLHCCRCTKMAADQQAKNIVVHYSLQL